MTRIPVRIFTPDVDLLRALLAATREREAQGAEPWVRPLDVGGSSGSSHTYRLQKLVRHGFVAQKTRTAGVRGSLLYTITDAGKARLEEEDRKKHG